MKKILLGLVLALGLLLGLATNVSAAPFEGASIKDGTVFYSAGSYLGGEPLMLGVDPYGYNYQAHMFAGSYFNSYANVDGFTPYSGDHDTYILVEPDAPQHWAFGYRDVELSMKWNDAWLSNRDRDGDHALDRHYGFASYRGSGAWITNHMKGVDFSTGKEVHWTYFVKIVAAPADATKIGGVWYDSSGGELGPDIWGEFFVALENYTDPTALEHGLLYLSMTSPGFGRYKP